MITAGFARRTRPVGYLGRSPPVVSRLEAISRRAPARGEENAVDENDGPVRYAVQDGVATITLDSPANRNALSTALIDALEARLDEADADPGVRAVRLTHTGGTFCAGADLKEALAVGMERTSLRLLGLLRRIVSCSVPVVACIDGHVRAGGLGLVGACDIVLAGPASTFAFTEVRLGLAPAIISLVTTPRLPDRAVGRYYLTGEAFGPQEAADVGLVTQAVDDVPLAAEAIFSQIRGCSPQGLAETKRLVTARLLEDMDARGAEIATLSARLFSSSEAREGMAAFAERRPPSWARPPETLP
jgi:enoyl-CoA hydratase